MVGVRTGPRTYKIFVCHRYGDDALYSSVRSVLLDARRFTWENLSVQAEQPIRFRSKQGLKKSITNRVKRADIMLVFAHSSGSWIDHELDAAERYAIPVVSLLDQQRVEQPRRRARSRRISELAECEIRLDDSEAIIAAIRQYARPQQQLQVLRTQPPRALQSPRDIVREKQKPFQNRGLFQRLARLFGSQPNARQDFSDDRPH